MKNIDLSKQFEDLSNDWLAKEKKREKYTVSFDSSESQLIRLQHENHCDANSLKTTHVENCANSTEEKVAKAIFTFDKKFSTIATMIFASLLVAEVISSFIDIPFALIIFVLAIVLVIKLQKGGN